MKIALTDLVILGHDLHLEPVFQVGQLGLNLFLRLRELLDLATLVFELNVGSALLSELNDDKN